MRVAMLRFTLQEYSALNDHRGVCDSVLLSWWAVILSAIYLMLHSPVCKRTLNYYNSFHGNIWSILSYLLTIPQWSTLPPPSPTPAQPQFFPEVSTELPFPTSNSPAYIVKWSKHVHGTLTFELTRTKIRMVNEPREQIQLVKVHIRRPSQWGATEVGKLGWKQDFPVFILLM